MANIIPVVNPSLSLITPGYPLVKVAMSHPAAQVAIKAIADKSKTADVIEATTYDTVLKNSGHTSDRVV